MKKLWARTRSRSRRGSEIQPPTSENVPPLPQPPRTTQSVQRTAGGLPPNKVVRPVLVGVSRNGEFQSSRPGTSGSLQNAVSRAADKTSQEFVRGHTRTKSPRYVDIFSVSGLSGSHSMTSSYNEEVAERNLDTRVARGEQYYGYIPASKYQEEVAVRNSYQSSDGPRSSHDRQHRSWISSGTESGPSKGNTPHTSWFQENSRPNSHVPPPANQQQLPPIFDDQRSTSTNPASVNPTLANYNLSKAEVSQPRPIDQSQHPTRSSSRMSSASHNVINLPHRTIMDLTGEDGADTADLGLKSGHDMSAGYSQVVNISSPPASRRSMDTATGTEASPTTGQEITPIAPSTPDRIIIQNHDGKLVSLTKPGSAFSIINTVASLSPTAYGTTNTEPATREESSLSPESPRLAKNRLSTVAEIGSSDNLQRAVPPPVATAEAKLSNGVADGQAINNIATSQHVATPVTVAENGTTKLTPLHPLNNIHNSPESIQSVDYINPSAAFGVRARDFAVTPSKSSLRADYEANTSAKVSKANNTTTEPAQAPVQNRSASPYTFDEEAFKRKQEAARAALVKLQQSLNEEFIHVTPPRSQSAPRPNRMTGVGQRRVPAAWNASDPHGPVAPPSPFSQGNGVDDGRGRATSSSQAPMRPKMQGTGSSSASAVTIRAVGRGTLQSLRPTPAQRAHTTEESRGKGKGKATDIEAALFDLQRTAEEITGPPRVSSVQPRPPRSPLRDRKGPNNQGIFGYGFGQPEPTSRMGQKMQTPASPGEVSLSNFPVAPNPTLPREPPPRKRGYINQGSSRPGSSAGAHLSGDSDGDPFTDKAPMPTIKRKGSTASQTSVMTSTSQYSIPFHMIPERGSSMRDSLVREVDGGE